MSLLKNYFTPSEQRILLFILLLSLGGVVSAQFTPDGNTESSDSLKVEIETIEPVQFDIQTVTEEELCSISGIGIKKAKAILAYRDSTGFTSLTDLLNIKGIGVKRLELIRGFFYPLQNDDEILQNKSFVQSVEGKIDINKATAKMLCTLPRIGPKRAKLILALRKQKGSFIKKEELLEVKGIGLKTLEKLKPYIVIGMEDE